VAKNRDLVSKEREKLLSIMKKCRKRKIPEEGDKEESEHEPPLLGMNNEAGHFSSQENLLAELKWLRNSNKLLVTRLELVEEAIKKSSEMDALNSKKEEAKLWQVST